MKILTIPQIRDAAKISASLTGINWDLLEDKKSQDQFEKVLSASGFDIPELENLYLTAVEADFKQQDTWDEEDHALFEDFTLRLMEEMHAAYTMQYLKETFIAVRDITTPKAPKKKRASRKKKPLGDDPVK